METRSRAVRRSRPRREGAGWRDEDGLVVVDADRRVRLLDHRARELLAGMMTLGELAPDFLLAAETIEVRTPHVRLDGRLRAVELRVRSSRVDGRDGWAVSVADVSHRKSPKDEASEFVSAVCHEMRTPLTGILGYADALKQGWDDLDDERRTAFLDIVIRQAGRLGRLTTDLSALSRPGRGLEVQSEAVPVERAVAETLAVMRDGADGVEVVGGTAGLHVRVDPSHFQNILVNLLSNARKYGRAPFVVEIEREDLFGVVRVTDAGDGVPEGFLGRMWDRFSRARVDERPRGVDGSGLGLAVVSSLVEANGGQVWYEPNEPTGSAFCVAFPLTAGHGSVAAEDGAGR